MATGCGPGDRPAADGVDPDQEGEEGDGEDTVHEIHGSGPVEVAMDQGLLDAAEGELPLDRHQEAEDTEGPSARPKMKDARLLIAYENQREFVDFLLSWGRQTGAPARKRHRFP